MPATINIPDMPLFLNMRRRAEGVVVRARSKALWELFKRFGKEQRQEVLDEDGRPLATLWMDSNRIPRAAGASFVGTNLTHFWFPDNGQVNLAFLRRTDLDVGFEMLLKQPVERADFERAHTEAGHGINYIFTSLLGEQEVTLEVKLTEHRRT